MLPRLRSRRGERGASAIEMALYMPILLFITFLAVQFSLVYLGNQTASAVARETARHARAGPDAPNNVGHALAEGYEYAARIGNGTLEDVDITITAVGANRVRVTVTGHAQELVPVGVPQVRQTVEGPLETFRSAP